MKIGDLVRDTGVYTTNDGIIVEDMMNRIGVIIKVDESERPFKVAWNWNGQGEEWMSEIYLEVISK